MDFQEISILANQGVIFVGTSLGKTRSDWAEWQHKGTDSISKLREWVDGGYGLVAVAAHGHQFMIDKDDPAACKAMGMPEPFLTETYTVDSPSGGEHQYGLHDEVTETLGNLVVVYAEPGNPKSKKILELKLNGANSVAAPTTVRSGQPGKRDGVYKPRDQKKLAKGLNPEFVECLRKHGSFVGAPKGKGAAGPARKFHPDFELDEHLEHHEAGEAFSYNKDGALHVVSNTCPLNGGPHRDGDEKQHARDRVTEFIYGKKGWGFSCVVCNVFTRSEFEEKMQDLDPEWEPYDGYVYEDEDQALFAEKMLNNPKFPVELAKEVDSGVDSADTLGKLCLLDEIRNFPESVNTADTQTRYSDAGNALRLAKMRCNDILYCRQADEYYVWDGTRWIRDLNNVFMLRMAKAVTEAMFEEAKSLGDEEAKALRAHALKSQYASRLTAMVSLAKLYVRNVNRGDFDKDLWLLNVLNGTVDLKAGICRPQNRTDLISKLAPVKFDSAADCPLWKKCLGDWMLGDQTKVDYLHRQGGYVLTGCTNEETMPILWGAGRNGKTKFYATIYNILGDGEYAKAANFDSFVVKKGDEGMPNDIAGWCGMRLIVAAEGEHSKRLAEAKLKLCIGRDPVVGEFKYQEEFSYVPTFKVWLITNPKPRIVGTGDAIWERIHFVAWKRFFREEERDQHLQEKLDGEASGILNWLIEGCLQWQKMGLALPECMREDTQNYRHEQDVVGRFIDEECVVGEEFTAAKKLTYICFKEWAEDAGEHYTMTQVEFNEKMLYKFAEGRSKNGRFWKGFRLKRQESEFEATLAAYGLTPEAVEDAIQ
jgi:P4 family phage/plasmid primase-like protien